MLTSSLSAKAKVNRLLTAISAQDWYAVFNSLRECDEDVRIEFLSWLTRNGIPDTKYRNVLTPVTLARALQYLNQIPDPALAVRAVVIALMLSKDTDTSCPPALHPA